MVEDAKQILGEKKVWFLAGIFFLVVLGMLLTVFNHERQKPRSPQGLVAAAFNQALTIQEWQPGMGQQPFMYHPAAAGKPVWKPLPPRNGNVQGR